MEFHDDRNDIKAYYEFGNCGNSKKPKDYFAGKIMQGGIEVSDIYGTYAGYCDFNGQRYYDARVIQPFMAQPIPETEKVSP